MRGGRRPIRALDKSGSVLIPFPRPVLIHSQGELEYGDSQSPGPRYGRTKPVPHCPPAVRQRRGEDAAGCAVQGGAAASATSPLAVASGEDGRRLRAGL